MFRKGRTKYESHVFAAHDVAEVYRVAKDWWEHHDGRDCHITIAHEVSGDGPALGIRAGYLRSSR